MSMVEPQDYVFTGDETKEQGGIRTLMQDDRAEDLSHC